MSNRPRPARRRPRPRPRADAPATPWVARSEVDFVAMVPQVLGFHPDDSVVLLSFGPRGSTAGGRRPPKGAFHARADLPRDAHGQEQLARVLADACRTNTAPLATVLVYGDDHDLARRQGELLVEALHEVGTDVIDVLRVHDGRWFEPLVGDTTGTAYDLTTHEFTARGVFEGRAVLARRSELEATLAPRAGLERAVLEHAVDSVLRRFDPDAVVDEAAWVGRRVAEVVRTGAPLGTDEAARLLVAVVTGPGRDAAWSGLTRDDAWRHVELWRDLVRRAPDAVVPSVAALLALAAYLHGDGALAWCAVDRARRLDPGHTLARLVADALAAAVPPSAFPTQPLVQPVTGPAGST